MSPALREQTASHDVVFYDDDDALIRELAGYARVALGGAGRLTVIATPSHGEALDGAMEAVGISPRQAEITGQLTTLDAEETLSTFMVDGWPDRGRMEASLSPYLLPAGHPGPVFAYGEMVTLLWQAGNPEAALALEELWNDLQARRGFTLLCGYPRAVLRQGSLPLATAVCRQHNDLSICGNAHSVATGVVSSEVFLPSPTSVSAARDFVRRSLNDADGCGDAADVVLVASEMVTNAVRHAGSAFRLTVTREQRSLRLEVEDVSPHPPKAAGATAFDDGGRGLPLIETLTNSWGHYPTSSGGKVVWAQFLP